MSPDISHAHERPHAFAGHEVSGDFRSRTEQTVGVLPRHGCQDLALLSHSSVSRPHSALAGCTHGRHGGLQQAPCRLVLARFLRGDSLSAAASPPAHHVTCRDPPPVPQLQGTPPGHINVCRARPCLASQHGSWMTTPALRRAPRIEIGRGSRSRLHGRSHGQCREELCSAH